MISYAQNFEDVMLWRALKGVENGTYIDIGACDPVVDSVSLHFYLNGWRGVHVEPVPAHAEALRLARPDEQVVEAAVGEDGRTLTIHAFDGTGLSTSVASIAERHKSAGWTARPIQIACISLSRLFDTVKRRDIHWLKIDVEGMEADVLNSWGDHASRPWIVLVESTLPLSQEGNHQQWENLLTARGYEFAYFDGLNRFYVHESRSALAVHLSVPPNVFDAFSVGEHTPLGKELGAHLGEARSHVNQLIGQVGALSGEVEAREAELARVRTAQAEQSQALTLEIEIRESELGRLRSAIAALTDAAERERLALRAEIAESALISEHWRSEAYAREAQVNAMLASTSWKVSAPVRWSKAAALSGLAASKRSLRPVLASALKFVRANPWVKPPLLAAARLFPPLQRKLTGFVSVRPELPPVNAVSRPSPWHVTPDTQLVSEWTDLLQTIPASKKASS